MEGTSAVGEKRVSYVELFYDLVFVFAVTQVAAVLAATPSWQGVLAAFAAFTPFWWSWVGTAVLSNGTDMEAVRARLMVFAIGAATLVMTVAVPEVFDGLGWLYAGGYACLRLVLLLWSLQRFGGLRPSPFTWSAFVTVPLLLATVPLASAAQRTAWGLIMIGELSSSFLFRARLSHLQIDLSHLPERFALVIIIALGESVVAAASALQGHVTRAGVAALVLSWALACGLWWTYFHFAASAVEHALRVSDVPTRIVRLVLAYGHYLLASAIIAQAVGMKFVIKHPGEHLHGEQWLLCGGAALYLAAFSAQRKLMFGAWSPTRGPAAVVALASGLLAPLVPAAGLLALVALVFAGLAALEPRVIPWLNRR